MPPLPKNKVTRRERGKRKFGNTPKFNLDINHAKTPFHKRGLVAQIKKSIGIN